MTEEKVVAQNQCNAVPANECTPQDEGISEPDRLLLHDVIEPDPPCRSIGQQMSIECEILGRRNESESRECRLRPIRLATGPPSRPKRQRILHLSVVET